MYMKNTTQDLDLIFRIEDIETNNADLSEGNYNFVIWYNEKGVGCSDDFNLVINADVENDIDYDSFSIHWVSINSLEVYNESDKLSDLEVDKELVAKFIENSEKVYKHVEDILEGLAESSRVEAQLSDLESRRDYFELK